MPRVPSTAVLDALSTGCVELPASIALVVAHPDDEVIGVGGRLAKWALRTTIVHVTDGAPLDGADARRAGFASPAEYAVARRRETYAAFAWLPDQPVVVPLGFTDQRVTHALYDLVVTLRTFMRHRTPVVVVTHAYEGGHPDHDAVAFAVQTLCGIADVPPFDVVEFAGYHEGRSGSLVTNRFADAACGDGRVAGLLRGEDKRRKRLMLEAFRSQRRVLEPFPWDEEWLRPAPRYDFSAPPAGGRAWFDRFRWGVTSEQWRSLAAAASARLAAEGVTC